MNERTRHRRAFDCYVRMGTDRSLGALARALRDDPSLVGLRRAPSRTTIERWSSAFRWQDRLVDIERAAREQDRQGQIRALADMNERHKKEGLALQQKALERIAALPADAISPGDAIRGLIEGVRLERLAAGAPTERVHQEGELIDGQQLRRFSTEELRRLAELAERRAAGAGEAHPFVVIQKGAQVFVTEYLINTALWIADTFQGSNGTALYVMPTASQVNDFSQARVDRAIGESPYLRGSIAPPPPGRAGPLRQGLKKIGDGYVYFRGSDARQLISVPADAVLLDEYDLMEEEVLPRAMQRLAASSLGWARVASTPRYPEAGINARFLESDQRYFFLKCSGCGREQRLEWEHNVDQKRQIVVCRYQRCRKQIDLWGPGHWEATVPGNDRVHGYHISRLYSPLANIGQLIYESEAATPAAMQEFQNSVLGETFVPPGGRLSIAGLDACRRDYVMEVP